MKTTILLKDSSKIYSEDICSKKDSIVKMILIKILCSKVQIFRRKGISVRLLNSKLKITF